jgi:hypothetical protein
MIASRLSGRASALDARRSKEAREGRIRIDTVISLRRQRSIRL